MSPRWFREGEFPGAILIPGPGGVSFGIGGFIKTLDHFRIGGVKLGFDGSPQGKTAWFTKAYFRVPPGAKPDYNGFPIFAQDAEAEKWVTLAYRNNWQVMVHAGGDAAIDQFIKSVRAAEAAVPGTDRRTVLIHGHFLRQDQIPEIKLLGIKEGRTLYTAPAR